MSILKRKNHAGKVRYTAVVRKTITAQRFSDSKTFGSLQAARAWERKRVVEFEGAGSVAQLADQQSLQQPLGGTASVSSISRNPSPWGTVNGRYCGLCQNTRTFLPFMWTSFLPVTCSVFVRCAEYSASRRASDAEVKVAVRTFKKSQDYCLTGNRTQNVEP